jgi:hypothetical protein
VPSFTVIDAAPGTFLTVSRADRTMPTARNARASVVGTTYAATCRSSTKRKMLTRSETANLARQTVAGRDQRRAKTRRGSITLATKP